MIYEFNKNGTCLNPTVFLLKETKQYSAKLSIAQGLNGKWSYGYSLNVKFGHFVYHGGGAYKDGKYDTMEAAKAAALAWFTVTLKKDLADAKAWNGSMYNLGAKRKPKPSQLKLFKS